MPFNLNWSFPDNDPAVTAGRNGLTYAGVIQTNDGRGGYNTNFGITEPRDGHYHVHFLAGSRQVSCIRYFAPGAADGQGINVLRLEGTRPFITMNAILGRLNYDDYPNHWTLINNFANALQNVGQQGDQYS
jgi:hypothetical protein